MTLSSGGNFQGLRRPARFALKAQTYNFGGHDGSLNIALNRPFKVKSKAIDEES